MIVIQRPGFGRGFFKNMIEELEYLKHDLIGHPLVGVARLIAHITKNNFFNELAEAIHDTIGKEREEC